MFKRLKKAFGTRAADTESAKVDAGQPDSVAEGERIRDKYPEVTKLAVNLSIKAPFEKIEPTVRGFSMSPDAMANFVFRCKNTDCIDGGFDLTEEVDRAIAAYETGSHGRRVCQGWDGQKNVGHQRCYYELNFIINISYE